MQNQKSSMQNHQKREQESNQYSKKDYWEGRVPDELFEEYLNKYGYEYP